MSSLLCNFFFVIRCIKSLDTTRKMGPSGEEEPRQQAWQWQLPKIKIKEQFRNYDSATIALDRACDLVAELGGGGRSGRAPWSYNPRFGFAIEFF